MSKREQIQMITDKLQQELSPVFLNIIDQSDLHKGHGGWQDGVLTHIKIEIESSQLNGLSRVKSHRLIMHILSEELNDFLHAVQITIKGCMHS